MEFDANIEHLRLAFWNVVMAAGPILGIALAIGLVIGIIQAATSQAATSINEMTLSFVPKLVFVLGGFALLSSFMMTRLSDYFSFIFDTISGMG